MCTARIYEDRQYHKAMKLPIPHVQLERPLVYYFGLSHLMCGMAHQNQGSYEQARECIYKYAELGWMEDLDEEGMLVVKEFRFLAKTNLYAVDILSENIELIEEYVAFLQDNLEEITGAEYHITGSAYVSFGCRRYFTYVCRAD